MTKFEFLLSLREALSTLSEAEVRERLNFYSEMIEDRVEEGLTEEEAVLAVGNAEEIAAQILSDAPASKKVKAKRKLGVLEIVLLVLGSPIWLSLLISAFAVCLSLYISFWAIIISLWAVFALLVGCTACILLSAVVFVAFYNPFTGIAMVGAAMVCAGLSVFMFYGCRAATNGILLLTKLVFKRRKRNEK